MNALEAQLDYCLGTAIPEPGRAFDVYASRPMAPSWMSALIRWWGRGCARLSS